MVGLKEHFPSLLDADMWRDKNITEAVSSDFAAIKWSDQEKEKITSPFLRDPRWKGLHLRSQLPTHVRNSRAMTRVQ